MSWHVRYFSPSLNQELLTPELKLREDALEEAWKLAENGEHVTAVEGPDGELLSADEIENWSVDKDRRSDAAMDMDEDVGWRLITLDEEGRECSSAAFTTREAAMDRACALQRAGTTVVVITSADGDAIVAEEITDWCKGRETG